MGQVLTEAQLKELDLKVLACEIEEQWKIRALHQGLNPKTKTYMKEQVEFFVGAMAGLKSVGIPEEQWASWIICIMTGRDIVNP